MKYLSLDIETTGLDIQNDNVLQIGAIVEDTTKKLPREECPQIVLYNDKDTYSGNPFALHLNAWIFKKILDLRREDKNHSQLCPEASLVYRLGLFLEEQFGKEKVIVAGKNVASFDIPFIKGIKNSNGLGLLRFHHRVIDPTMMFIDLAKDSVPPDLATCKARAGLPTVVTHDALDDAWDVITLLRTKY